MHRYLVYLLDDEGNRTWMLRCLAHSDICTSGLYWLFFFLLLRCGIRGSWRGRNLSRIECFKGRRKKRRTREDEAEDRGLYLLVHIHLPLKALAAGIYVHLVLQDKADAS